MNHLYIYLVRIFHISEWLYFGMYSGDTSPRGTLSPQRHRPIAEPTEVGKRGKNSQTGDDRGGSRAADVSTPEMRKAVKSASQQIDESAPPSSLSFPALLFSSSLPLWNNKL